MRAKMNPVVDDGQNPDRPLSRRAGGSSPATRACLASPPRSALLQAPVLALLIATGSCIAQPAPLGATLDGLLDHARANNRELASMRLEADAASERIGAAGALPDPVL